MGNGQGHYCRHGADSKNLAISRSAREIRSPKPSYEVDLRWLLFDIVHLAAAP